MDENQRVEGNPVDSDNDVNPDEFLANGEAGSDNDVNPNEFLANGEVGSDEIIPYDINPDLPSTSKVANDRDPAKARNARKTVTAKKVPENQSDEELEIRDFFDTIGENLPDAPQPLVHDRVLRKTNKVDYRKLHNYG